MRRLALILAAVCLTSPSVRADAEFFEKRVRPVLAEHCYSCHSANAPKLRAGLRVDGRDLLLKGGDSGPAIVPGKPSESRLLRAIEYDDVDLRMPPKGKLPAAAIADLTKWIQDGAAWPEEAAKRQVESAFDLQKRKAEHWAWQPVKVNPPPTVRDSQWPKSIPDRFVLAKFEAQNRKPPPPVPPHVLLRRTYFDLIGLPPPADVAQAFAADPSPARFERIVDWLLGSQQFGERWARHWLDLVRYAETRGNEFDYINPNAWQYRDYVIRAFNADVPYNQLVMEHLAGDLLPEPRRNESNGVNESILATGCWFFADQVHSPVDLKIDEADHIDARIDVFTKTFLGMTVSCARCHDHKFDAISAKDYHALFGVFASSGYRQVRFETEEKERKIAERLRELEKKYEEKARAEAAASGRETKKVPDGARTIIDYADFSPSDWRPDGAAFGDGPRPAGALILSGDRLRINTRPAAVFEPAFAAMKNTGQNDPGDLGKANRAGRTIRTPSVTLQNGRLFYLVRGQGLAYAAVNGHLMMEGPLHRNLVQSIKAGDSFRWIEHDLRRYAGHRAHVEFTATGPEFAIAAVIESETPPTKMSEEPIDADALNSPEAFAAYRKEREAILRDLPDASAIAPALYDGNSVDERVFIRGNPHNLGERVPRRFLEALVGEKKLDGPGSGRLELARLVTDPAINPLIGRVIVNRVWHHLFGKGIVPSVDNFGVLGERPINPELLDWLADDFVRNGWSIKRLIRVLVLSRYYQSDDRDQAQRLDAEAIRDSILAVSGMLDKKMFGPPVPIHLTAFMEGRGRPAKSGPLDGAGRRSIYLEVRRNFPMPFLATFDQPAPGNTVGRRTISNVPAQALVLMNDPFVHEQADIWGQDELLRVPKLTKKEIIEHMYWAALSRLPSDAELKACLEFVGDGAGRIGLPHAMFNLKEFIYIR